MRIFSYEELDELGEGLIRQYLGKEAERTCCVDIEGFVTDFLKLPLLYRSFAEEDSDKIGFIADGVTPLRVYEGGTVVRRVYPGGTIVIERCLRQEHESGRRRFTISHECAHYIMDRAVPSAAFHREFDNERIYSQEDFKNLFSFRETQVDRMGAALLMPRSHPYRPVKQLPKSFYPVLYKGLIYSVCCDILSFTFPPIFQDRLLSVHLPLAPANGFPPAELPDHTPQP